MKILGIIPARFGSIRFPGKPLADIHGKPMVQRVYEQALKAKKLSQVVIATDDTRISNCCEAIGAKVLMTSPDHKSGTERCKEAAVAAGCEENDVIINIQGDEPFINPEQIDSLASMFTGNDTTLSTLIKAIDSEKLLKDPNVVKVVVNRFSEAIYFSRASIPFFRIGEDNMKKDNWGFKHIGIYGYRFKTLLEITALKPSMLEIAESLEQLRWIENGYKIKVAVMDYDTFAVDTPEDLKKIISGR